MNRNLKLLLKVSLWIAVLATGALIYYANHYLPKGPMFSTGDIVCQNDDRGPCAESYIEEVRNLDIPQWAKLFKKSEGMLLFWALLIIAVIVSAKNEQN